MTRQEQIKEIAKIIAKVEFPNSACWDDCKKCFYEGNCNYLKSAERIYDAGWCKQIEAEWVFMSAPVVDFKCGNCGEILPFGMLPDYTPYCPRCGARMVGRR